jgi:hypothetical protein
MSTDLRTRMYNYEVTPPEGVWDGIQAELNENGAKVIPIEYGQKRSSFSYVMIAAALSLVLIVSMVLRMQVKSSSTEVLGTVYDTAARRNYVMITNPEGQEVKVSTKVAPMIVSENNQSNKTSRKSEWSKKMEKWKATMMTATTTNFMDIVDIAANN